MNGPKESPRAGGCHVRCSSHFSPHMARFLQRDERFPSCLWFFYGNPLGFFSGHQQDASGGSAAQLGSAERHQGARGQDLTDRLTDLQGKRSGPTHDTRLLRRGLRRASTETSHTADTDCTL